MMGKMGIKKVKRYMKSHGPQIISRVSNLIISHQLDNLQSPLIDLERLKTQDYKYQIKIKYLWIQQSIYSYGFRYAYVLFLLIIEYEEI